ncbi:hypothetical protein [Celeribacter sp. PS-C1]|uniref:hypothetical protein n=1 Tax=Celeribacter sp. PS-C1 TaxID=2820813 RepID=UPI001CA57D71|nr:hypothetical protein [Celeribacter sp. PS-C1]MBW6419556.1 hypothetical protein [Celeribacter sp. PS-C1]
MAIDENELVRQLDDSITTSARTSYELFARAKFPTTLSAQFGGHGYIDRELRFHHNDRWYFAAVLNKSWVLWYFRRPAISDLGLSSSDLIQIFPAAEVTSGGEVKIRVQDQITAYALLGWLTQTL